MKHKVDEHTGETGQSLAEFALGMVILLLLLAGAVDLGRLFFTFIALRDAAQEGAVYGSICPDDLSKVETRIRDISAFPLDFSDTTHITIQCTYVKDLDGNPATLEEEACTSPPATPVEVGSGIKIAVQYNDFRLVMPFMGTILGQQTLTLSSDMTDTILRNTCP